jgi:hypothetical protein
MLADLYAAVPQALIGRAPIAKSIGSKLKVRTRAPIPP